MRVRLFVCCLIAAAGFIAATSLTSSAGSSASAAAVHGASIGARGSVVRVIDGDTLVVRLAGGTQDRVRVLGIDSPEMQPRERCADQATNAAKRLAQGKTVGLVGDRTQAKRDRYQRLLAYVTLPDGTDLGRKLIAIGYAKVYVYRGRPFLRVGAYRTAEKNAQAKRFGLWGNCSTATVIPVPVPRPAPPVSPTTSSPTTTLVPFVPSIPTTTGTTTSGTTTTAPPPATCHPSYPDFCIPPPPPDKDCADFTQKNFRVLPPDPHRLDGNSDGVGCES